MRRSSALVASFVVLVSCGPQIETTEKGIAISGPWSIPPQTLAIGDNQYVEATGAGPWIGSAGCADSLTPGAVEVREFLYQHAPQIWHIGGFACRAINGNSSQTSVHATGRALDLHVATLGGSADNTAGDPVGNWLIENAEEIGIQYIIWDRWSWRAERTPGNKDRSYGGAHPHHDHLHVELSIEAADLGTPWFSGPREPPPFSCASIPAAGRILEERDPCFEAFGPSTYWRFVEGSGHGGSLFWTNAFESSTPSNWARWNLDLDVAGRYAVELYADPDYARYDEVQHEVRHDGVEEQFVVDQSSANGWLLLGELDFAAGSDQWVAVFDHNAGMTPADQHIALDALRLTPVVVPEDAGVADADALDATEPGADAGIAAEPDIGGQTSPDGGVSVAEPLLPFAFVDVPAARFDDSVEGFEHPPRPTGRIQGGCRCALPSPDESEGGGRLWLAVFALGLFRKRRASSRGRPSRS